MSYLESLAERFVEQDGLSIEAQDKIANDAAEYVRSGWQQQRESRDTPAAQLALSIGRWIAAADQDGGSDGAGLDDIERKARAHRFVARVLRALPKSTLRAREVKMFTDFFSSMYQIGDTNIVAVTEALSALLSMDNFTPSSARDILSSIGSMPPESFTKQLAKTRLEVFKLINVILSGASGRSLRDRDPDAKYLLPILALAGKERDPQNLLEWFRTLRSAVEGRSVSTEVADAVFETISPFFPISIRRSTAVGPDVSEEQLKLALNACFSVNGRLAQRTFPFMLQKLDHGSSSLTASAKLDIIRTIKSCVEEYEPVDSYVLPYISSIWSSLKFEVRNGEVPEAIHETLSVFESASRRLSSFSHEHLKSFVEEIWKDCAEDLENPTYTEKVGSILVSVARANLESFRLIRPRLLDHITRVIYQPKSQSHAKDLLVILNNLLRVRRRLKVVAQDPSVTDTRSVCFKILKENAVQDPSKDQVEIAKEALHGLAQIVQQRRYSDDSQSSTVDCEEDAFLEICGILSYRVLNCFNLPLASSQGLQEIEEAVVDALKTTVVSYPKGYAKLVSDVYDEVVKRSWSGEPVERSLSALRVSCLRLEAIGCHAIPSDSAPLVNFVIFTGGMLKILGVLFATKSRFDARAQVVNALCMGMASFGANDEMRAFKDIKEFDQDAESWSLDSIESYVENIVPTFPNIVSGQVEQFSPLQSTNLLHAQYTKNDQAFWVSYLKLATFIAAQLYQHATEIQAQEENQLSLSSDLKINIDESGNFEDSLRTKTLWRNTYLKKVGDLAGNVIGQLDLTAQQGLMLDTQIWTCFQPLKAIEQPFWSVHVHPEISFLSRGVAQGILPKVALKLHGNIHSIITGDLDTIKDLPPSVILEREGIAFCLANKFDTRDRTHQEHDGWVRVLTEIEETLKDENSMAIMPLDKFSRIVAVVLGATNRGDRFITPGLKEALANAAVKGGSTRGKYMARLLDTLFIARPERTASLFHVIRKPLHQQWSYHYYVHPILQRAYPLQPEGDDSVIYAIYVLHAVKNLKLDQYGSDSSEIIRVVLAAMQKAQHPSDINAACEVALHILTTQPELLQDHVSSVVSACKRVYLETSPPPKARVVETTQPGGPSKFWQSEEELPDASPRRRVVDKSQVRMKSVRLLRALPQVLDERFLRRHVKAVVAHLSKVLGDPSREVRRLADVAKDTWTRVPE